MSIFDERFHNQYPGHQHRDEQHSDGPRDGRRSGEVTALFARALDGDDAAELELACRALGGASGPHGRGDPVAMRALLAIGQVAAEHLERAGWGPLTGAEVATRLAAMSVADRDQHDAATRDLVAGVVARAGRDTRAGGS